MFWIIRITIVRYKRLLQQHDTNYFDATLTTLTVGAQILIVLE